MTKQPTLPEAALAALMKVDGTPDGSRMPVAIRRRLTKLELVEPGMARWPLWRSSAGNRRVRVKK
jgi:hypothetical protein